MNAVKHIFAVLAFFPITTALLISITFELIWNILHVFHYERYDEVHSDLPVEYENFFLSTNNPELLRFLCKFISIGLYPFCKFLDRLKEVGEYKF